MKKTTFLGPLCHALMLIATLALATAVAAPASAQTGALQPQQPKISSRQIPVLTVGDLKFRDLNRNGQLDPYEDWRLSAEARAADLVARMSLAEKAGTMIHGWLYNKSAVEFDIERMRPRVLDLHITSGISYMNPTPPKQLAEQHNRLQELAEQGRLGVPITVSTDPRNHFSAKTTIGHGMTIWPDGPGFGAIGDLGVVRRFADISRREYRAVGIHMALSPMAELATEPRWGRINGTFGEDPKLVRDMVRAYVEGFQGGSEGVGPDSVISVVKHWAGYGAAKDGIDAHNPLGRDSVFPGGNFQQHLDTYEGAFEVNVGGVMPTYTVLKDLVYKGHAMEQVAGAYNKYLLTNILRGDYGFDGMILSDFGITQGNIWGTEDNTRTERYALATQAGIDQFGGGNEEPSFIVEAVELGLLSEAQVDVATQRILKLKFQLGLFENPYVSPEKTAELVNTPADQAAALDAQHRSLVLLKNEESRLPLKVAQANRSLRVYLRGIETDAAEAQGLQVVDNPAEADVALIRLEAPDQGGGWVGIPQGRLDFAPGQPDFDALVSLASNGLPVIASVNLHRPAVLTALLPHVQGLFGDFGISDQALLDVILGKAKPEGRLPIELPSSMAAVEAQKSDLPHDSENPLFPIRYGLSYP